MEIISYESESGTAYVPKYLNKLNGRDAKKILDKLINIGAQDLSDALHSGVMKKLKGNDLYEIIIEGHNVGYRIFCTLKFSVCWLLHIFKKKTNSTPKQEIETALERARKLEQQLFRRLN